MTDKHIKHFASLHREEKAPEENPSLTRVALDIIEQNHKYYKYLCPRCTGVAYYTNCIEIEHPQECCSNCKLPLPQSVDDTRFVELTEEGAEDAGLI